MPYRVEAIIKVNFSLGVEIQVVFLWQKIRQNIRRSTGGSETVAVPLNTEVCARRANQGAKKYSEHLTIVKTRV